MNAELNEKAKEYSLLYKTIHDDAVFEYLVSTAEKCFESGIRNYDGVERCFLGNIELINSLILNNRWHLLRETFGAVRFNYDLKELNNANKSKTGRQKVQTLVLQV